MNIQRRPVDMGFKGIVGAVVLATSLLGGTFVGLGSMLPFLAISRKVYYTGVGVVQWAWGWFMCGLLGA